MKACIGVTQALEKTEEYIVKELKIAGEQTVVGPFASSDLASEWVKFMMARAAEYENVMLPANSAGDSPWYGVTFEQITP